MGNTNDPVVESKKHTAAITSNVTNGLKPEDISKIVGKKNNCNPQNKRHTGAVLHFPNFRCVPGVLKYS